MADALPPPPRRPDPFPAPPKRFEAVPPPPRRLEPVPGPPKKHRPAPSPPRKIERLFSLDAFRGLTIAAMIVVNNPGAWGEQTQFGGLRHAAWHGCTPTDLVFPFFLFIVGAAIPYSMVGRVGRDVPLRILRRSAALFALGLFLRLFPSFDFAEVRIPGVLQRIAVVYLVAALLVWRTGWKTQAYVVAGLLLGYWALLALVPPPGGQAGVLEKEGNLVAWLDVSLLDGHLYEPEFDPEGILSTLPAIGTALLGVLAGHWLRFGLLPEGKGAGLLAAGLVAVVVGWAWGGLFPINKQLWTSSYAVFTAGWASMVLGVFYGIADTGRLRMWAKPLAVFGTNAIAAFALSTLLTKTIGSIEVAGPDGDPISVRTWLWREVFAPDGSPKAASLAFALAYTSFIWLLMFPLYRKRIFLRV